MLLMINVDKITSENVVMCGVSSDSGIEDNSSKEEYNYILYSQFHNG